MKNIVTHAAAPAALNPDHNIWNNNGTWWCHYTVHREDHTAERLRVSLRTRDRAVARQRRDLLMAAVPGIVARLPRAPAGSSDPVSPSEDHGLNL